jgi:hypothetical protein
MLIRIRDNAKDCFARSDNIDELTTSVLGFIGKCIGDVVPTVKVRCFPNQKPWINTEVDAKIKDWATAHRAIAENPEATAEDKNKYKKSCIDLRKVIKREKGQYRNNMESYYTGTIVRRMWQWAIVHYGLQRKTQP